MSTIQQSCPSCQRLLELPSAAAGRTAQCPACQAQFVIAGPTVIGTRTPISPAAPTGNPYADPIGGARIDEGPTPFRGGNPYQPAAAVSTMGSTVSVGAFRIGQRSVEEIFGATWAMFKERWGSLVGAFLIVFAASIGMMLVSAGVSAVAQQMLDKNTSSIVGILMNVITTPISAFLYLGLVRNALAVARNEPSPIGQLTPPMLLLFRFLGGGALLMLAMGGVFAVVGGIGAALVMVAGQQAFAIGLIGLLVLVMLPAMLVAYWMLWSWPLVVADGRTTWLDAFRVAQKITMQNKMTSLLLIIITAMLGVAGLLACYIGQIFTTPLTTLMMATGYLMITSQPIADPRVGGRSWE